MALKTLLILCLVMYISIIAHEIGHYIMAKLFYIDIEAVHLGSEAFSIKIKKVYISPFIYKGNVEVSENSLNKKGKIGIICFFLGGILMNLLLIVFCWNETGFFFHILKCLNFFIICSSIWGVNKKDADLSLLIEYIKMK